MINMFDIKNLGIRDYIICGLLLIVLFLIYKYFINSNKIKSLEDEIDDLNNKIKLNKQIMNNNITNNKKLNYESECDSITDDNTINYKTGQTLETFNNTIKDGKGYNTHTGSLLEQNSNRFHLKEVNSNIECNDEFCYIKKPVNNFGQFEQNMNNLSKEVDNIIKSDVYIPIDLKQIINNVYDFPEINEDDNEDDNEEDNEEPNEEDNEEDNEESNKDYNNNNFNPIIINNEINITQDDIENNKIIQIPDFINLPITLGQSSKEFDLPQIKTLVENSKEFDMEIISETSSNSNINLDEIKNILDEKQDNSLSELNKISKEEHSVDKIKNMKINDIKNLAKEYNIKVTENGRPKTKDQLVKEINDHKNKTSNI
jgi:hypothetical protein